VCRIRIESITAIFLTLRRCPRSVNHSTYFFFPMNFVKLFGGLAIAQFLVGPGGLEPPT
jgi:hypothetical protein